MIYVWILFDVTKIRTLSSSVECYNGIVEVASSNLTICVHNALSSTISCLLFIEELLYKL